MNISKIKKRLVGGFQPFVLRTSDGREFTVPHPEFIWITPANDVMVADADGDPNLLDPLHIVSLRELRSARKNGKHGGANS